MTYRFENKEIEKNTAIETVIAINAEIAVAHRNGGELLSVSVEEEAQGQGFKTYLQFRFEEQVA